MVHYKSNFAFVEYLVKTGSFKFVDGYRSRNIIGQHKIKLGTNQLACAYMVKACMRRQYFLRHGHSHFAVLLSDQKHRL